MREVPLCEKVSLRGDGLREEIAPGTLSPGYRGTSLIRNTPILGLYSRIKPRVLWWSQGRGWFLMSEAPLCEEVSLPKPSHQGR